MTLGGFPSRLGPLRYKVGRSSGSLVASLPCPVPGPCEAPAHTSSGSTLQPDRAGPDHFNDEGLKAPAQELCPCFLYLFGAHLWETVLLSTDLVSCPAGPSLGLP